MHVCAQIERFSSSDQNRFCLPFFATIMGLNNVHDRWWTLSTHAIARQSRGIGRIQLLLIYTDFFSTHSTMQQRIYLLFLSFPFLLYSLCS
jgi:hypothetical protein